MSNKTKKKYNVDKVDDIKNENTKRNGKIRKIKKEDKENID